LTCRQVHKYLLCFIFLTGFFQPVAFSQSLKDTLSLKEIEIKASYLLNNQGFKKVRIDSSLLLPRLNTDLSTILSQNSTIFIKSYGSGGLATASFRGTSANHTQVEWNGININSPMLGQTDLSLIPVSQFDGIELLYGSAGISKTSGAFGGVINLVTNPDWNNKISLLVAPTFASFGTYNANVNFAAGNTKFQSISKLNYTSSKNDFPYYDNNLEIQHQKNGSYNNYGFTEELFFKATKKDYLTGKVWYSNDDRNLPPIVTNVNSINRESIKESTTRSLFEWKRLENKYYFTLRSAFIDQNMNYKNDSMGIDDNHHYNSLINRLRFIFSGIKKLSIKPGVDFNYDWVSSDQYNGNKTRSNIALFSEQNYELNKHIQLSLILREELIDMKFMPFIFALGVNYKPFNKIDLSFTSNISRNFRFPTLNELYWKNFGNEDLLPENDYSAEVGTLYHFGNKKENFFIETILTGYYSFIDQYIQVTFTGGNTSKPENISEVLARGVEAGLNISWTIIGFTLTSQNNYHFCKSTYEKTTSAADESLGKQLIYIPRNTFNSTLNIKKRGFYFSYNFNFVGKRYTGRDNLTYMGAYNLSNIILGKNFSINKFILSLQLQINNLFDLALRSIASVPLPGRNYALTIRFNFIK
jgi:outer membrane cobalamin receptor